MQSSLPRVFFGGDAALGPKNIIWAVAQGHAAAISIDKFLHGEDVAQRPAPGVTLVSQKMGIHEWSYDNDVTPELRHKVPWRDVNQSLRNIKVEVELGFDVADRLEGSAALPQLRRADGVHDRASASSATPASTSARPTASRSPPTATSPTCARACARRRATPTRRSTSRATLKTGRVMVKDEDVCLHCGLCAERCPTGAWDMQKFTIAQTRAGHGCRSAAQPPRQAAGADMTTNVQAGTAPRIEAVNDFVVKFANVNGSGSASANELFARSLLRMGVPVSPRNIFPSNIQGLPTWYEVRVSERGYLARRGGVDLMVAMNPQTWDKRPRRDRARRLPAATTARKPLPASKFRDDIHVLGVPLTDLCATRYTDPRERQLLKNIVYVGVLAAMLGVEPEVIATLLGEQYKGKTKLLQPNLDAFMMGLHHGREYFDDALGLKIERRDAVGKRIFIEGNAAAALGCVYGGATVCAWYPITPSSSLAEAFQKYCSQAARRQGDRHATSSRSCRPRTRSPRSASSSAPAGTARARSPRRRARASR